MKSAQFVSWWILAGLLFACAGSTNTSAQQQEVVSIAQRAASTGTYVYFTRSQQVVSPFKTTTNSVPLFTVRLETNGTYFAESALSGQSTYVDGAHVYHLPDVAKGTWRWDAQNREFLLAPGSFTFGIERLPVDRANPNRLVWGTSFLERQDGK